MKGSETREKLEPKLPQTAIKCSLLWQEDLTEVARKSFLNT
jgi:hypothetical protein